MKYGFLTVGIWLLIGVCVSLEAAPSYDQIDALGGSRSRYISDESQIAQLLSLLQKGVQQFDSPAITMAVAGFETKADGPAAIPSNYQLSLDSLFAEAEQICPTSQTEHPGWISGAFDWFSVRIVSIVVDSDRAVVVAAPGWTDPQKSGRDDTHYEFQLTRTQNRWTLDDFAPVLSAVGDYLMTMEPVLRDKGRHGESAKSGPSYNDYATWLQHSAKDLLLEQWFDQGSGIKRFTKTTAENLLGGRVFSCAGSASSFYYQGDPLIGRTVSVAAVSDHCWQRFVVADQLENYITAKGRAGTGNNIDEFATPGGLEFRSWGYLYVCDRGNDRIKVVGISDSYNQHVALEWIVGQTLHEPIDLDVTMDGHVIVAEAASNSVACFCDPTACSPFRRHTAIDGPEGMMFVISRPVAVCFSKDPVTSAKNINCAYLLDRDGTRIMRIDYPFAASPFVPAVQMIPDPIASATDVSVDNRGQVWVVDSERGRIYKFDPSLRLLAIQGEEGTGDAEYLYPRSLAFTQAYQYGGQYQPPIPLPSVGEAILTEQWGSTTGIRRLVSGVDIFTPSAAYSPRLTPTGADFIAGQYFTTDYADLSVQVFCNSTRYDSLGWTNIPPGVQSFTWYLTPSAPSGTYEVRFTARSVFNSSNTAVAKAWVPVDTSITNQLPIVSCIYFPNGDTCFLPYVQQPIKATANDPDGSIANYFWSCDPVDAGDFSNPYANPTDFTANPPPGKTIKQRFVRVRVTDNYGQYSPYKSLIIDNCPVTRCVCLSCGDANSDGVVDISDAVFLISYIFSGGAAPADCSEPVGMGDASGNGSVDISDAVYLISYIFAGGGPPHCP